jgi:protoporphyrinogen oxidase
MGQRIAVIGAGPMGLAVAYQLSKDGYQPVLFEADDRVGGMTASFDFDGMEIERYYHFHCTSDKDFLEILDDLNLSDYMQWKETKMGYWFQNRLQPWGNPLALLKFKGVSLNAKFRYGLHAFLATKRNNWEPLDAIEATKWIRSWVGKEAYEKLWRRLFDYKFYDYAETLSAAWIWSRIRRVGRSRYDLFREKLGYLEGGSNTLLKSMQSTIEENGGSIRLNSSISKIDIKDGKIGGVEANGVFEQFDTVISTVPLPYIPQIIPDLQPEIKDKFKAVKNVAVACVIVKLKKAVTENFWLNINDPDMDIPGLVEYTNLYKLGQHIVYIPFYMPSDHPKYSDTDQVFENKVKKYLMKINPSLETNDFIDITTHRYKFSQPVCNPGYLDNLPPAKLPVDGLWVADSSYYYPEDRGISESIGYGRKLAKWAVA